MPTRTGELVSLAVSGDKKAFEELYINNFNSAYFPAYGLLKDKQEAMKITLNCFANAFKNLSRLSKPDSFEDWIRQITVKKCIEIMKKKGVAFSMQRPVACRVEIDGSYEFLPIEALNSKELMSVIMKTVDSMPDTQRSCVYLCYYSGYSVSAIANLLSCADNDVKSHLFIAREQIKKAVDSNVGSFTELSRMNGTSILSLVMEDMKKEIPVGRETAENYFAVIYEKAGLSSENRQKPVAPVVPAVAVAPVVPVASAQPTQPTTSADPFDFFGQDDAFDQNKPAVPVAPVAPATTSASADPFDFFTQEAPSAPIAPAQPTQPTTSADPFDFFAQDESAAPVAPVSTKTAALTESPFDDFIMGDSPYTPDHAENKKKNKSDKSGNKTPVIIAVVAVLLIAVAAVAAWFVFGNESDSPSLSDDVTFSDDYNDNIYSEPAESVLAGITSLPATESDYIKLTDLLNELMIVMHEYDSSSPDAKKLAYDFIYVGCFSKPVYTEFFGEPEYIEAGTDPLDKFNSSIRIIVYPEKNIDWIIRNIFGLEPDRSYDVATTFGSKGYYHNGYYYVVDDSLGDIARKFEVVSSVQNSDGTYTITIRYFTSGPDEEGYSFTATLNIKAALKEEDGKRYWTLHCVEYDDSDVPEFSTEQTSANNKDYMSAYNKYLKNYNGGEYERGFRFELVYLNDDDVPELFLRRGGAHLDQVTVLTYTDGEVVEVGDYGIYGQLNYVERESVIVTGNMHMGYQSGAIIRLGLDGSEETLFSHHDNENAEPDPSELFFKINDKNVSKKEYEKAVEENMDIETSVFYEGIPMTDENIDKYCS